MATTLIYKMAYPSLVAYTNIDHVLKELTPYMLQTDYVERKSVPLQVVPLPVQVVPLPVQVVPLPVQVVPLPVQVKVCESTQPIIRTQSPQSIFNPKSEDTLFWCVYIAKHGIQEYRQIPVNRHKNREIEEKQKIVAHFHTSPATRPVKMSMVLLKELLGEISTDRRMTLRTLPLWRIFYELSCVHVLNRSNSTYLTYSTDTETKDVEYLYYDPKFRKYSVFVDTTVDSSATKPELSTMLQIDTYNKPFKSISNYKVDELQSMISAIGKGTQGICGLGSIEKPKKQDLYQALYNHCIWIME
jgi:hypothetical protein